MDELAMKGASALGPSSSLPLFGSSAARATVGHRRDIDGLRALAVLPVILFHLRSGLFSGGFIGVDVFFVISGFLITGVIAREMEENRFSILKFYERRARRILPALFATCLLVLVAGLLIFMPDELRDVGTSLVGVATFSSNVLFWQQIDYFNGAVELKPLLHTWSLAVEEQFYLFLPLLLLLLGKKGPGGYRVPLLALLVVSFAGGIAAVWLAPEANYYLLPTRAWELLAGSVVALGYVPPHRSAAQAEMFSATGIALILGASVWLDSSSPFPGYNALWPCLGAAMFIHANSAHETRMGALVGTAPLIAIGLISYSLYLVHWPVIVFFEYALIRPATLAEKVGLLAGMIALAALFWRFVEQPVRNREKVPDRVIWIGSAIGLAALAGAGLTLYLTDGLPRRFANLQITETTQPAATAANCFLNDAEEAWGGDACFITRKAAAPVTLLWGDSHANHYKHGISASSPVDANILLYSSAACLPVLHNTGEPRPYCDAVNARVPDIIDQFGVQQVILSGHWEYASEESGMPLSDVAQTVRQLRKWGLRVMIVADSPEYSFSNPEYLAHRLQQRDKPLAPFYMQPRNDWRTNRTLQQMVGPRDYFDPAEVLCRKDGCLVYENGETIMSDNGHFSVYGSKKVAAAMLPFVQRTQ
ncbi:acyltransferase family protein [Croceibacterium sp. TMG7-5b_MA50]|uniref:acyltransferase family protein n=1 Tax=Croceibacterium sp. TMG7-5b_MA50 TaxID=3121290 RepID=UPI0032215CA9